MAFSLTATVGSTSLNLANKSPYGLLHVKGASGVPMRRVTERGPSQVGDTDVGFRLNPRTIELAVSFYATTDAILDGYRDSLTQFFKPLTSTPVILTFTRDDGAVRQIDCYTIDEIEIDLVKEFRPGHLHNATIRLQAPNPAFYNPTPGTVTVSGSAGTATDWYLAGGVIGTASVLMSGGTPTQGQAWSYAGSIAHTTSYTLAVRATQESFGTADKYMFYVDNTSAGENDIVLRATTSRYVANSPTDGGGDLGTAFMPAGTTNYYIRHGTSGLDVIDPDGIGASTTANDIYAAGTASLLITVAPGFPPSSTRPIGGTARRWRSDATNTAASRWNGTVLLYALYSPGLTATQIAALDTHMAGSVGGTLSIDTYIPYAGNLAEYPTISVTGPISSFYIINTTTRKTLDFGTSTIGAGTTWVITTQPGQQSILEGTVNRRDKITSNSDLDNWYLTPDASGQYNSIVLVGVNTSSSTSIKVVYYNRYSSY